MCHISRPALNVHQSAFCARTNVSALLVHPERQSVALGSRNRCKMYSAIFCGSEKSRYRCKVSFAATVLLFHRPFARDMVHSCGGTWYFCPIKVRVFVKKLRLRATHHPKYLGGTSVHLSKDHTATNAMHDHTQETCLSHQRVSRVLTLSHSHRTGLHALQVVGDW